MSERGIGQILVVVGFVVFISLCGGFFLVSNNLSSSKPTIETDQNRSVSLDLDQSNGGTLSTGSPPPNLFAKLASTPIPIPTPKHNPIQKATPTPLPSSSPTLEGAIDANLNGNSQTTTYPNDPVANGLANYSLPPGVYYGRTWVYIATSAQGNDQHTQIILRGSNFGTSQGKIYFVKQGGQLIEGSVESWNSTENSSEVIAPIPFTVDMSQKYGVFIVTTAGDASNEVVFPDQWFWH